MHGLEKTTSDNGERLVSFAGGNSLCITYTFLPHKCIHQATWYPPNSRGHSSLKDYILVKQWMMASILDTRVYTGGDIDSHHHLVIMSLRLKLKKKLTEWGEGEGTLRWNCYRRDKQRLILLMESRSVLKRRKRACACSRDVEERWNELKTSLPGSAEEHLKCRRKKKRWISEDTMKIIEAKRKAFIQWEECRTNVERQKEYWNFQKRVRRAVKEDRKKWVNVMMKEMEDSLKHHRQGDFYKNLRQLNARRVKATTTNLDESVLNVQNAVAEDVIADVEDLSGSHTRIDQGGGGEGSEETPEWQGSRK